MMVSFYFSPSRGVSVWDRNAFIALVDKVPTLRQYIAIEDKFNEGIPSSGKPCLDQDIDFLMKFETLADDFLAVCHKLQLDQEELPVRNKSSRVHYSEYYDKELIEIVGKKFREEIEFGDYKFISS